MIENLTFTENITELLSAENKNDRMKGLVWNLIDSIPTNISVWEGGKVLYANAAFYSAVGVKKGNIAELNTLVENDSYIMIHPDDFDFSAEETNKVKKELSSGIIFHKEMRMKSRTASEYRWFNTYIVKASDPGSKVVIEIDEDIHDKKIANDELREALRQKDELLKEKDLLLKEVHHRVKNNFMVISSLLKLQFAGTSDEATRNILKESRSRILSMSKIHERLYKSENLKHINLRENITDLVNGLVDLYDGSARLIEFSIECGNIELAIDKAIPCSMIINEVLSNCLKYAFSDYENAVVSICIAESEGNINIKINDNGIGLPPEFDSEKSNGIGLLIVKTLAKQLDGDIGIKNNSGAEFNLVFPAGQ